jgi:hypothetical protein
MQVEGNRIVFQGDLRLQTKGGLACMFQLAEVRGYQDIILDFASATYADANTMLPVSSYAAYYQLKGIDFAIKEPTDPALQRLFVNANWAHLISPKTYPLNDKRRSNNLPALQFMDGEAQFAAVNRAIDILLETIKIPGRSQLKALEWSLNEITDNVLNHAESPIGGILQIQCFPVKNRVSFFVVDAGIGISKSLRSAKPSLMSDAVALDQAIREGVTRNSETNQGNGLYGTFKCCDVSQGSFYVLSNHAELKSSKSTLSISSQNVPFRGSFINATINYSTEGLLEKALVFKGKPHQPAQDYIDYRYDPSGDNICFKVLDEVEGFGSREFGRRARQKVDNLMSDSRTHVSFDFQGVPLISSSFADEVFGKLFVELGAIEFMRRCSFSNIDDTVRKLIDRAIAQRMRAPGH